MEARHRKNLKARNEARSIFLHGMWFNLTDVRQNKIPVKKVIKSAGAVNMRSHTRFLLDSYINPV